MKLKNLEGKKILILGFGKEGKDTFLFLRSTFPESRLGIADAAPLNGFPLEERKMLERVKPANLHLGEDYLKAIKKYDILVKAPGIPTSILKPYLKKNQSITSQTNIFFENCPGTIIGITGTKGKSTTASLIHEILKAGSVKSRVIGNIGLPVLQYIEKAKQKDIFIYELSSFQLEHIKKSPSIAVFLNLYPEHLNHHGTFAKYASAKLNITRFQKKDDVLIFNAADENVTKLTKNTKARKIPFRPKRIVAGKRTFVASPEPAVIIGRLFGIAESRIVASIKNFKPLSHRLEFLGTYRGIDFYNDSLSTIPEATIAALDSLGPRVSTLIVGGFDRGVPFDTLVDRIQKSDLQTLIFLPTTGEKIADSLKSKEVSGLGYIPASSMREAVSLAYRHAEKGSVCLLSPAASSFNMFRDYQDRGEQFKKFVGFYGTKK